MLNFFLTSDLMTLSHLTCSPFIRTMSFRKDSDVVVRYRITCLNPEMLLLTYCRHGYIEKRADPLSKDDLSKIYGQVKALNMLYF